MPGLHSEVYGSIGQWFTWLFVEYVFVFLENVQKDYNDADFLNHSVAMCDSIMLYN